MKQYRVVYEQRHESTDVLQRITERVCASRDEAEAYIESFMPGMAYWIHCDSREPYVINLAY